jgi:hypothetical protein
MIKALGEKDLRGLKFCFFVAVMGKNMGKNSTAEIIAEYFPRKRRQKKKGKA